MRSMKTEPKKFFSFVKNKQNVNVRVSNLNKEDRSTLRERLRTHKVFTKDQCFYLNYYQFSIKSYVLDMY